MKYKDFLTTLTDCPFCNLKQRIVIENDSAYLTYSLAPYHADHLLVIPKKHMEHFLELTEEITKDVDVLLREGIRILNKLGYENVTMLIREGMASGKSIPHVHYHIIPDVIIGDTESDGKEREVLSVDEIEKLMSRLMTAL